jgi:hypothetical protein
MLVRQVEMLRNDGSHQQAQDGGLQPNDRARPKQSYYEGAYDLNDDEALYFEVAIPKQCGYWSLILTNEIYETTDWYNNQSSLNGAQAVLGCDRVFRAVISARDPGVHNWLDTAGNARGAVQGRWLDCDERPLPNMRKVKFSELGNLLPLRYAEGDGGRPRGSAARAAVARATCARSGDPCPIIFSTSLEKSRW